MTTQELRQEITEFLKFIVIDVPVRFTTQESVKADGYQRLRISYTSEEGDEIPAYLLLPEGRGPFGAVLVHHQHHGQRHFGKSEVCGLVGNPLQAFGPALVKHGFVVLAPDSICFEDRRKNRTGILEDDEDVAQHFNELCHRLVRGDTLMQKVLSDSAQGISLLRSHPLVDPERLGMLGHSYGGNTTLFHGALDERIRFACASGAAGSYQHKLEHNLGIEMAEVIPGFAARFDIQDLAACFTPRPLLIVSATEDASSQDANEIVTSARETYPGNHIDHKRYEGGHAVTQERLDTILSWLIKQI